MSTEADDRRGDAREPHEEALPSRYASLEMDGDVYVIYDREAPAAWIQTDSAMELAAEI